MFLDVKYSKLLCYKVVNVFDFRTISPQLIRTVKLPRHKQVKLNVLIFSPSLRFLCGCSLFHSYTQGNSVFVISFRFIELLFLSFLFITVVFLHHLIEFFCYYYYIVFLKLVLSLCFYILFQMLFNNLPCAKITQSNWLDTHSCVDRMMYKNCWMLNCSLSCDQIEATIFSSNKQSMQPHTNILQ